MFKDIFKNKKVLLAAVGCMCGILLILLGSFDNGNKSTKPDTSVSYTSEELDSYTASLEKRISALVGRIDGISDVTALVTVDASKESVYATSGSNRDYVIIKDSSGNESALKLSEINATIRGIAVVCDYGGDNALKMQIIELLSSLFGIGSNRISVMQAHSGG